ncbi:MAG: DNA repair protein RecO [Candidatus Magasanikbacteria bacterium]|nr:DNA repair protein RecO [Candidatus Magasanikbacteria bacterium]
MINDGFPLEFILTKVGAGMTPRGILRFTQNDRNMLAITLARRDFREYDQTIVFYTKEQGKIEAVARGIKKITAKNAAALEPFALLDVEIIPGKGVRYIGTVEVVKAYGDIRTHLDRTLVAQNALATVSTLIVGQEKDERIFRLVTDFLEFLNTTVPGEMALDKFVIELVSYLGFAPSAKVRTHADLLGHVRYYTGITVADWGSYQKLL